MSVFQTLIFLLLFGTGVGIAAAAVMDKRRNPGRERPAMWDGSTGPGDVGSGGCGGGGSGGGDGG